MMNGPHHGGNGMHWMHTYGNGYGIIWMILFWILLLSIVVYLIVKIIKSSKKELPQPTEQKQTPLHILQERLVRGDIDEAEYERLKAIIKKDE